MCRFPSTQRLRFLVVVLSALAASSPSPAENLSSDLELIPRQATAFIHFRAADLYRSEAFNDFRTIIERAGPAAFKAFARKSPIDPASLDRVTLLFLTPKDLGTPFPSVDPEATSAIIIIRTNKPFDRLRVLAAMGVREKLYQRRLYHFNEELWSGMVLLDERTLLIGAEDSIVQYFDLMRRNDTSGPLQTALVEASAGKQPIIVGINPEELKTTIPFVPGELQPLFTARCGTILLNITKELRLELRLDYAKAEEAQEGEKAVHATINMARQALTLPIGELEKKLNENPDKVDAGAVPENFGLLVGLGYLREIDNLLAKAPVERDGNRVRMPLVYHRADMASLTVISLAAIQFLGASASTTFQTVGTAIDSSDNVNPTEKHLKAIYQALEKHHADKGSYPPPATYDADGRPLLSWRVALLPYLGDEARELYAQFRQEEPWDSLHNKRLIKKMPAMFQSPTGGYFMQGRWKTYDLVFVGPDAVFAAKKARKKAELRPDAALLVHATHADSVYWTKPADLVYAADQPLPNLFEGGDPRFRFRTAEGAELAVLLANGTYRTIKQEAPEKEFRQLIEGKK